jgi:hypothetical protein
MRPPDGTRGAQGRLLERAGGADAQRPPGYGHGFPSDGCLNEVVAALRHQA